MFQPEQEPSNLLLAGVKKRDVHLALQLSKEHEQSTSSKLRGSTISKTLEKTCRLGDKDISFPSGENSNSPLYPTEIYTAYARKYYLDKLYRPFEN